MSIDGLIINLNRLSHELSGAVAAREQPRIETQLADLKRCPQCGSFASFDAVIAPPPVNATDYASEALWRAVLSDYHVDVRFTPCGHEVDLQEIDDLVVTLRDGPIEVDYTPDNAIN